MSWLDDLYGSPSSTDITILDIKDEIISSIIHEFDAMNKSVVRIRWVINQKLGIKGSIASYELLEVFYSMVETGDYEGDLFKYEGLSDILIRRKPWYKRNRILYSFLTSAVGYISTIAMAFIIGLLFGQSCNR
jgi:hypothetical protein